MFKSLAVQKNVLSQLRLRVLSHRRKGVNSAVIVRAVLLGHLNKTNRLVLML